RRISARISSADNRFETRAIVCPWPLRNSSQGVSAVRNDSGQTTTVSAAGAAGAHNTSVRSKADIEVLPQGRTRKCIRQLVWQQEKMGRRRGVRSFKSDTRNLK